MFLLCSIFLRKLCDKVHHKLLNTKKFAFVQHIDITSSVYFCHSTEASGALKEKCHSGNSVQGTLLEDILPAFERSLVLEDLKESDLMLVYRKFGLKGLDIGFLNKYSVRVSCDLKTLLFPFNSLENQFSAVQTMMSHGDIEENITRSFYGSDNEAVFGWSLVGPEDKEVVVTSDPLDAIVVNQRTNLPAISLPFKDPHLYSFSFKLLSLLNVFNKVIFWMAPDIFNWDNYKLLRSNFKGNGFIVSSVTSQHPLFCLQNGIEIPQILKKVCPLYDVRRKNAGDYKEALYAELQTEKVSGLKWKRFAALNDILKGHRKGELTVFSGQTGTGKTTFMCEYSLDLCLQGRRTLWINLEITYPRLLRTILCQFSKISPEELRQDYEKWHSKFDKLPMEYLTFSHDYSLDGMLDAMLQAVLVTKAEHIIVDNLQFMTYLNDGNSGIDYLRRQDRIFSKFRKFASDWNIHITVIIHPRKELDYSELTVSSISGTAKATQEADNVLLLQTKKSRQYLEVTKNRFDGEKGYILLEFDRKTYTYTLKAMNSKGKSASMKSIEDD